MSSKEADTSVEEEENKEKCDSEKEIEPSTEETKTKPSSESAQSFETPEIQETKLNKLAKDMFQKTYGYLQLELLQVMEDYMLLENLNTATASKYKDMRQIAENVHRNMKELNEKYKGIAPYLAQIEQIEDSVNKLEQAAYKLDSYSKRLENKFKALERR